MRDVRAQRPTAHELLKHQFLKRAKKTAFLLDLIERFKKWKAEGGDSRDRGDSSSSSSDDEDQSRYVLVCARVCVVLCRYHIGQVYVQYCMSL